MHSLRIWPLLLSTWTAQTLSSLILSKSNISSPSFTPLSQPPPHVNLSNDSPYHTCHMPSSPLWLKYTLQSTLSRSGISALLAGAQYQVGVQLDFGLGKHRIGPPLGRYRYNRVDLTIYAGDIDASEEPNLTWEMVYEAIELVRYCTVEKGVYVEMEAGIYGGGVRLGVIKVKLARMLDGDTEAA